MKRSITLLSEHARIIWAVMLREVATRYGRNNIGFFWVILDPMVFAIGVLILWRSIRGPYENSVLVIPFVLTGYMPMILVRHIVTYSINAVRMNSPLLYHKNITILDLYLGRIILEFVGVTLAGFILFTVLFIFGLVPFPVNVGLIYLGWSLDGVVAAGLALIVGSISDMVEVVERIISVTLYILVPLSGTFFLADWIPEDYRHFVLLLPFLNVAEMIRYGLFGDAIHPHYDIGYTAMCAIVMLALGLLLSRQVRGRVEIV